MANVWLTALNALVNQAIQRSQRFRAHLEELQSKRFSSSAAPVFLLQLLSELNDRAANDLARTASRIPRSLDYATYEEEVDKLKVIANALNDLFSYLTYIELSRVEHNPPGITSAISRIARELMPDQHVLICPSILGQYKYVNLISDRFLASEDYLPEIVSDGQSGEVAGRTNLAVLFYPSVLKDDVLCQVLLSHELMHFYGEVTNLFTDALPKRPPGVPADVDDETLMKFFVEYVADIGALYVAGPAYLFALIEFHTAVAAPSQRLYEHPPLLLRIRNALDTLSEYGQRFEKYKKASPIAKSVEATLSSLDSFASPRVMGRGKTGIVDPSSIAVFRSLKSNLKKARSLLRERLSTQVFFQPSRELFSEYLAYVQRGVPPGGRRLEGKAVPIGLGDVLNAVWLYRVWELQRSSNVSVPLKQNHRALKLNDLSRLAQLAIRQNETLHLFQEAGVYE